MLGARCWPPLVLVAFAGCTASGPPAPVAPAGRAIEGRFQAASLGVDKRYRAWLPARYDAEPTRRWPVVYLLHGLGGNEDNWLERGGLAAAADAIHLEAIVIMPDGDSGFYANRATAYDPAACRRDVGRLTREAPDQHCVETARYEDYLTRDLIAHVDATYRTIADRRGRAIGGLSMGGFGALMLAMRHPDLYASAASHSGVDALLYGGPHPYVKGEAVPVTDVARWGEDAGRIGAHIRAIFGPELANWQAHDPVHLAGRLQGGELALYLDCGSEDRLRLQDHAQYLHDVLLARGIAHAWYLGPGDHDFGFWSQRIDDSLRFHASVLARR